MGFPSLGAHNRSYLSKFNGNPYVVLDRMNTCAVELFLFRYMGNVVAAYTCSPVIYTSIQQGTSCLFDISGAARFSTLTFFLYILLDVSYFSSE